MSHQFALFIHIIARNNAQFHLRRTLYDKYMRGRTVAHLIPALRRQGYEQYSTRMVRYAASHTLKRSGIINCLVAQLTYLHCEDSKLSSAPWER
jgi:hypothetical protein